MTRPIPEYGHLMTIEEFSRHVESGMFVDYDGHGNWATSTHIISDEYVKPSMFTRESEPRLKKAGLKVAVRPPEGATHVVWYNK
jgi:hypothetical protein